LLEDAHIAAEQRLEPQHQIDTLSNLRPAGRGLIGADVAFMGAGLLELGRTVLALMKPFLRLVTTLAPVSSTRSSFIVSSISFSCSVHEIEPRTC
jgi:hypothetical protein